MGEKIVLIDGHSIINRAFYGVPQLTNSEGLHTNAVYGFLNIMFKIMDTEKPDYMLVAFDMKAPTFRHEMYSEYKGTRKGMPDELHEQVPVLQDVLRAMGVCIVTKEGIEADDILGTMAKRAESQGMQVTLVSGDRDLLQIASDNIKISIPKTKRGGSEVEEYHTQDVIDKYGITPAQIVDLKGLMGDASDNIPGVSGIGEKTATKILNTFPTVENAYENIEEVEPKRTRELLRAGRDMAFLSKTLATIKTDCALNVSFDDARLGDLYTAEAFEWIKRLELKSLIKKFDGETTKEVNKKPQNVVVMKNRKEFLTFVKDILKAKPDIIGIAFLGDEWTNTGAKIKKKKNKKSGGQMSFVFDDSEGIAGIAEERGSEGKDYNFLGFAVSVCRGGECLTGCGLKMGELTGDFFVEICRELILSGVRIALHDWKNTMHLVTPETHCESVNKQSLSTQQVCAVNSANIGGLAASDGRSMTANSVRQVAFPDETPYEKQRLFSNIIDVKIGAYLLSPLVDSYEPDDLARTYLSYNVASYSERFGKQSLQEIFFEAIEDKNKDKALDSGVEEGKGTAQILKKLTDYLGEISSVACMSAGLILKKLDEQGMEKLFFEIEMPTAYYLYQMERIGVEADKKALEEMSALLEGKILSLETEIYDLAGEEFNINSPKQLGVILFEKMKLPFAKKTKTGYSTSAEVLEKLRPEDPIINRILEYRQVSKLKSTYADGLPVFIEEDGRIHGKFNQTITATGRISSTEPNLQNIPIRMELGRQFRKVFKPKEGCVFLDADYSQIELRVLAHMSGDSELIEAYHEGKDIHRITAAKVFNTPFDEVTDLQRRNAKAVNFGIVYGISAFGLSQDLNIAKKEAQGIIDQYFATYPAIKKFLDGMVEGAKKKGYSETIFGRKRPVPELASSNFMQRSFGERVAMNSPIQGTAADIIKIAMIRVAGRLEEEGLKCRIVLQVHDELLLETPENEVEKVKEILLCEMPKAADLSVPLLAEVEVGKNWFEAH